MTVLGKHTYRIAVDFKKKIKSWTEYETGEPFEFPSGVSMQIQIGIRESVKPETFFDVPAGTVFKLEIKDPKKNGDPPDADDPAYMSQEFTVASLTSLSSADWQAGTSQHATFDYAAADTALPPGEYWMAISGVLPGGEIISPNYAKMNVVQDGTGPETTVAPQLPAEYSASEVDALLANKVSKDANGIAVVDILLEDATGVILPSGVLARVGQSLVFGDGVSLAESLPPAVGRRKLTLINKRTTSLSLDDLGVVGRDSNSDPVDGWFQSSSNAGSPDDQIYRYGASGQLIESRFHHDGSQAAAGWYTGALASANTSDGFIEVGDMFEITTSHQIKSGKTSMGGRMRADYIPPINNYPFASLGLIPGVAYEFSVKFRVYNPTLVESYSNLRLNSSSGSLSVNAFVSKINDVKNNLLGSSPQIDGSGSLSSAGQLIEVAPYPGNYANDSLYYTIESILSVTASEVLTVSFEIANGQNCLIDIIEAVQI